MTTDQLTREEKVSKIGQTTLYCINFSKSFERFLLAKYGIFLEYNLRWHELVQQNIKSYILKLLLLTNVINWFLQSDVELLTTN